MEASEVVDAAHEFLLRISQLVPPEHLHVSLCSSGSGGRLRPVAALARTSALASAADSTASLVVREGVTNSFHVRGARATAVLSRHAAQRSRMLLCLVLVTLLVLVLLACRRATPRA